MLLMALTFVMNSLTRGIYMLKWLAKKSAKILTVNARENLFKSALVGLISDFLEIDFYFIAHFLERGGGLEKCNLLNPQNLFLNVASISVGNVYVNFLIAPFLPKRNVYFQRKRSPKRRQ